MAYKQKKFGGFGDIASKLSEAALAYSNSPKRKLTAKEVVQGTKSIVDNLPSINIGKYKNR